MYKADTVDDKNKLPKKWAWWPILDTTEDEAVKKFKARYPDFETAYYAVGLRDFWFAMDCERRLK